MTTKIHDRFFLTRPSIHCYEPKLTMDLSNLFIAHNKDRGGNLLISVADASMYIKRDDYEVYAIDTVRRIKSITNVIEYEDDK